jgi:hypothetical protein
MLKPLRIWVFLPRVRDMVRNRHAIPTGPACGLRLAGSPGCTTTRRRARPSQFVEGGEAGRFYAPCGSSEASLRPMTDAVPFDSIAAMNCASQAA